MRRTERDGFLYSSDGVKPTFGEGRVENYSFVDSGKPASGGAVTILYDQSELAKISNATARDGFEVSATSIPLVVEIRVKTATTTEAAKKIVRASFKKSSLKETAPKSNSNVFIS